jgi:hypothetical protein
MKRREFLKTSIKVSTLAGLSAASLSAGPAARAAADAERREYYELRVYRLKNEEKRGLMDGFIEKAAIPALNRVGIKPVGVFVQQERKGALAPTELRDPLLVYVLRPYPDLGVFATAGPLMYADAEFQKAGAEFLQSPKSDPAFERIDSWLMIAFAGMPKLELPAYCQQKKPRMFEIRTYESHSEVKAVKKVQMFNAGEIQTMREVGLGPIFYGSALIGSNLPHLTYMLSAENPEEHEKHWDAFKAHPTWKKLKDDPQYADTVSKIYNRFLVPTPYSQI